MITERLQDAIRSSGVTRYAIWKRTGIGQDTLCHFMKNETGLALSTVDKILDALGLEIVIRPRRMGRITRERVQARREK
jgi:DNA-binding phage protein